MKVLVNNKDRYENVIKIAQEFKAIEVKEAKECK